MLRLGGAHRVVVTVVVAALFVLGHGVLAGAQQEQVVADAPGAMGLTAYDDHVVWSALDPQTRRWRLMHWHAGAVTVLPVAERRVPFDADAGPDSRGRPVLVFSRCRSDPPGLYYATANWALAAACDIWQIRLDGGTARRVRAVNTSRGSETTPSIWQGAIAFQRRLPGRPVSQLLLRPRQGGLRRLPVGSIGKPHVAELPGSVVSDLDLGPNSVAFVWLAGRGRPIRQRPGGLAVVGRHAAPRPAHRHRLRRDRRVQPARTAEPERQSRPIRRRLAVRPRPKRLRQRRGQHHHLVQLGLNGGVHVSGDHVDAVRPGGRRRRSRDLVAARHRRSEVGPNGRQSAVLPKQRHTVPARSRLSAVPALRARPSTHLTSHAARPLPPHP